jgi:hypothetical protein
VRCVFKCFFSAIGSRGPSRRKDALKTGGDDACDNDDDGGSRHDDTPDKIFIFRIEISGPSMNRLYEGLFFKCT